jgi:hypothetical protein
MYCIVLGRGGDGCKRRAVYIGLALVVRYYECGLLGVEELNGCIWRRRGGLYIFFRI